MLINLFYLSNCVTFQNGKSKWNGKITTKEGYYSFEKMNIRNVQVKDVAAISVVEERASSEVLVRSCVLEGISSGSGSCCFYFNSKNVTVQNCCFSNLNPNYANGSGEGGCCLSVKSVSDANFEKFNIFSISNIEKNMYCTICSDNSSEKKRDVNQTKCSCWEDKQVTFVCGFLVKESISNDRYIKISNSRGAIQNMYNNIVGNCLAEDISFDNCSLTHSIICGNAMNSKIIMSSCVVTRCKGEVFFQISGSCLLDGWYSDVKLPSIFKNTQTVEIKFPLNQAECAVFCEGDWNRLDVKSLMQTGVITLSLLCGKLIKF